MKHPGWDKPRREGPKQSAGGTILWLGIGLLYAAAALYYIVTNGP